MLSMTNLVLWFLQGTSGAIAGYITNKYAVNMLFKEYTPFRIGRKIILPYKFGGVIKNRKEKFVAELSDLVERDIINGRTIKPQLNTDCFKEKINKLSYEFVDTYLEESFSKTNFSDIPGFDETEEEILKFTQKNMKSFIFELADKTAGSIKIADFINDDEIDYVSEKVYKMILDEAENGYAVKELEKALHHSLNSIKAGELLTENSKEAVMGNIISVSEELIFSIINDDDKIIEIINKGLELSEAEDVIEKFQSRLKEKKISDYISAEERNNLAKYIYESFNSYLIDNGNELIKNIINSFIRIAEETDYTIYDFFGPELSEKIIAFINEKLPVIMPYVSEWIINNKDELDGVIEESIDEAIGNMDPNIKKLIISKVREFFLDNISAKNKVVDKIVSYIESYKMDDESSEKLINKLEIYLKQTKVKDIVALLEEKNIINDELINNLSGMFINEYKKHGESFIEQLINILCQKNIGTIIKYDFKELFDSYIKGKFIDYVLDNRKKLKNSIEKSLEGFMKRKMDDVLSKSIGELVPSFNMNESLKEILITNKINVIEKLRKGFTEYINKFDFYEKFVQNQDSILDEITNITVDYERTLFEKYKDKQVSDFIGNISDKEGISRLIENELIQYLNNNSEEFLKGKVKRTVYNNLIKYDEDEICDLAQRFMGNELKPLSIFGGVLGLGAGLIFGSLFSNVNIFGFYRSYPEGFLSVVLMGLIGVLTNVIAITMLFKPYKKSRILGRIPLINKFALGYIPAHKDNLGKSVGKAIDDDILNSTKIQNILINNKDNMLKYVIDYFENSNYKAVMNFISHKKNRINEFIYKKLIKNMSQDDRILNISDRISNVKIMSFISRDVFLSLIKKVEDKKNELINIAAKYLYKKITTDNTIEKSLSMHVLNSMNSNIGKNVNDNLYNEILSNINIVSIGRILDGYTNSYSNFTNKHIGEIFSADSKETIENYIRSNAERFVFNELKEASISVIKKKFISEFDEEKSIEIMFDGKIKILINENLNKITDIIIDKLDTMLIKNEISIGDKVKEEVNKNLNFFEKIAYSMAGGDAIVESCVSIAVNKKIPLFINMKFYEINNLIQKSLDNAVYPLSVQELKLKADEFNVSGLLNNIFESSKKGNIILPEINKICADVVNSIYDINACELLEIINLNSIECLKDKFEDDINYVLFNIKHNLEKNKVQLQEYIDEVVKSNIILPVMKMPVCRVLNNFKENDVYYALNIILNIIYEGKNVDTELIALVDNIYEDKFASTSIRDLCGESIVNRTVEKMIINILSNEEILNEINSFVEKALQEALDEDLELIDAKFREEVTKKIIAAVIDCSIANSKELIEGADLQKVTYEQIKVMDSKEIHDLFNSFAGTFFKKLYAYGAFGAVFGINLYFPILWAIKDNISSSVNNIKNSYKVKDNIE